MSKIVSGQTTTYEYHGLNRLTSIGGTTTASYTYNGDGLRVSKTVNGTLTNYAWDPSGLGTVLADGPASEYVWGQGLISQVTSGGAATYSEGDGMGSVRQLTDGSGATTGTEQEDAYGQSRGQAGTQLPFQFTGEQTDGESGLQYPRGRFYDPSTGCFLSQDPTVGHRERGREPARLRLRNGRPGKRTRWVGTRGRKYLGRTQDGSNRGHRDDLPANASFRCICSESASCCVSRRGMHAACEAGSRRKVRGKARETLRLPGPSLSGGSLITTSVSNATMRLAIPHSGYSRRRVPLLFAPLLNRPWNAA